MRILIVVMVLLSAPLAEAGPLCWHEVGFAPYDKADLPIGPTIAYASRDRYYGGRRYNGPALPQLTATIDGKRVPMTWNDVAITSGGAIRLYSIRSQATGTLELWRRFEYDDTPAVVVTYTIRKDWTQPSQPAVEVHEGEESNGPYGWVGQYAGLQMDLAAVAFTIRWRAAPTAAWRKFTLPVHAAATVHAEVRLGEESCGMHENLPMKELARGGEVELFAKLPNGRDVPVLKATPLRFVPTDPMPKPVRATGPPPEF